MIYVGFVKIFIANCWSIIKSLYNSIFMKIVMDIHMSIVLLKQRYLGLDLYCFCLFCLFLFCLKHLRIETLLASIV